MKTVQDIMTKDVWSVRSDWSLEALSQFFFDKHVSGAPVVDHNDTLLGVVSITDLARSSTISPTAEHETHDYYLDTRMTPMIFEVEEDTNVDEAANMMLKGRIHRVFVTRDKKVVGVVTTMDMLKVIGDYK